MGSLLLCFALHARSFHCSCTCQPHLLAAGVVQFEGTVMQGAAPLQMLQPGQTAMGSVSGFAAAVQPDTHPKKAKGLGKQQPWHDFARKEMLLLPRYVKGGGVEGHKWHRGQFAQVCGCMHEHD